MEVQQRSKAEKIPLSTAKINGAGSEAFGSACIQSLATHPFTHSLLLSHLHSTPSLITGGGVLLLYRRVVVTLANPGDGMRPDCGTKIGGVGLIKGQCQNPTASCIKTRFGGSL